MKVIVFLLRLVSLIIIPFHLSIISSNLSLLSFLPSAHNFSSSPLFFVFFCLHFLLTLHTPPLLVSIPPRLSPALLRSPPSPLRLFILSFYLFTFALWHASFLPRRFLILNFFLFFSFFIQSPFTPPLHSPPPPPLASIHPRLPPSDRLVCPLLPVCFTFSSPALFSPSRFHPPLPAPYPIIPPLHSSSPLSISAISQFSRVFPFQILSTCITSDFLLGVPVDYLCASVSVCARRVFPPARAQRAAKDPGINIHSLQASGAADILAEYLLCVYICFLSVFILFFR